MYKIENSPQLKDDILHRTLEGWAKEEPEVTMWMLDKLPNSLIDKYMKQTNLNKQNVNSNWSKKVSLVTNEGGVTSFQRSLLSFHSPMLARSVGKHGRGNKKDDRNKQNPFPGWCWGLARQVGMPPDCQWAFPQAKAHWFASLRCSATERQTLTTVLLIRWYNIYRLAFT